MGITAWVSTTNKTGVSNWLFLQGCRTESRWQHRHEMEGKDSGMAPSPSGQACNQLSAQELRGWVQALWALTADRFLTPNSQGTAFLLLGQFFPAKGMMEQVLQIKGETQPVKKILPRLSGFTPFSWLNFIFLVPSRSPPTCSLQTMPGSPEKPWRFRSNGIQSTETQSITLKATIWHVSVLQC